MEGWLIDESRAVDESALDEQLKAITAMRGKKPPPLAIRINDIFIYDTKKWFGSADIRKIQHHINVQAEGNIYPWLDSGFKSVREEEPDELIRWKYGLG